MEKSYPTVWDVFIEVITQGPFTVHSDKSAVLEYYSNVLVSLEFNRSLLVYSVLAVIPTAVFTHSLYTIFPPYFCLHFLFAMRPILQF